MTLPTLDTENLLCAIDHDLALLHRMFDQYRASLEKEYPRIEQAFDAQNYATLCEIAHKLEGMLGNFSCPAAIDAVRHFHREARAKDAMQTRATFQTLQLRTQELLQALEALLQNKS